MKRNAARGTTATMAPILEERKSSIMTADGCGGAGIACDKVSVSGSVSQRACAYCGARVVLNPITNACHIIHGPIGCSSYTWDIRGSLTSGEDLFRHSFCTDMRETDIIFGGEKKLIASIDEAVEALHPKVIFVYATCIVGIIGDDVHQVCADAEERHGIRVIPVQAPGFSGTKSTGYRLGGQAIMDLIGSNPFPRERAHGVNILGDFNLAGETWIVKGYCAHLGIDVVTGITGDASVEGLMRAPEAKVNVVQCAGSMSALAETMETELDIPFIKVSFYGIEDTTSSLVRMAEALGDERVVRATRDFCSEETRKLEPLIARYTPLLAGKRAAIYVGGGFKAISLIRQFREFGIETVMVGTQTGRPEDYDVIRSLVNPGCVILDDANPAELERFMVEKGADILVGGVKERPLAYKLGVAFCDHNHERKHPLAGYVGVRNFAEEINSSMNSPVWRYV